MLNSFQQQLYDNYKPYLNGGLYSFILPFDKLIFKCLKDEKFENEDKLFNPTLFIQKIKDILNNIIKILNQNLDFEKNDFLKNNEYFLYFDLPNLKNIKNINYIELTNNHNIKITVNLYITEEEFLELPVTRLNELSLHIQSCNEFLDINNLNSINNINTIIKSIQY